MAAAVPAIIGSISAASSIKQARDARKLGKEQLEQQERAIAEQARNTAQESRAPTDAFRRRRRGVTPGFTDTAALNTGGAGYGGTALGA